MKYKIYYNKIYYNYNTGDSFYEENNIEEVLEGEYTNLDIAKANIKRIEAHYKYYREINGYNNKSDTEIRGRYKREDWYVEGYDFNIKLQANNGEFYQIHAPWCGYFESLNSVEIKSNNDNMKILIT
jgi:hypothetical protein